VGATIPSFSKNVKRDIKYSINFLNMRFKNNKSILFGAFLLLALLLLFFTSLFLQKPVLEEPKSVFILVLDGVGASYLENLSEQQIMLDGVFLRKARLESIESFYSKSAVLKQPFTKTTAAHSLYYISGDCGRQWDSIKDCVDDSGIVSICDFYRSKGYLCIMVSAAGDFREARNEFDVALYDNDLFDFRVQLNSNSDEAKEVAGFLREQAKKATSYKLRKKDANFFVLYSAFIIDTDYELIKFLRKRFPEMKFFLFSNAKGTDKCGHNLSALEYVKCIEGLDSYLKPLADNLADSNVLFFITADHGMAFDCLQCNGHHASKPYSETVFAKRIPFIFVSNENASLMDGTAYDLMPSVFELSGFSNACAEMRYCEGNSLVVR